MYVLNNITAINTDQHLPNLKFSKDNMIRRDLNPKTVEIEMQENENLYKDEISSAKDILLPNPFPNGPQNSDEDKDDRDHNDHGENQEHEDHKDTVQVETYIKIKTIMDAVHKLSEKGNERKTITFLDFSGKDIYYAFNQIYFSPDSFSILVVDMRKDPKQLCENNDICCSRFNSWTYKGN